MESGAELLRRLAKADLLYSVIVFIVSLLLYSWTLAPTVTLVDSGELIVAAHSLGVAHPPGFPLYVVLAHIASLVPIGTVAQRVHFASALFAASAAALTVLFVAELITAQAYTQTPQKLKRKKAAQGRLSSHTSSSFITFAPAFAAGLLVAFSRTLWSYATIAEVYTLNTSLIAAIFWLMAKWRRKILEARQSTNAARRSPIREYDPPLYIAAGLFGLALGVHHVTVALTLPALAWFVWATVGLRFFASRRLVYAASIAFATLILVYSYLPISASHDPIINWGDPRTLRAVWAHITGKQYQVFFSFDTNVVGGQSVEFAKLLLREFGPWWLPLVPGLAIVGAVQLFRRDRAIFWFLSLLALADIAYGFSYVIAEDKDAYYLPTFLVLAFAGAFGLRTLLESSIFKRGSVTTMGLKAAVFALIVPTCALAANWPFNNRHHYFIAHDYVENILGPTERGSLLLTLDWQVASPMLYTREVEHLRRDVKVIDVNLLRRLWYFDYLKHAYPELIERSRDKVDSFVAELRQWDADPRAYADDPTLTLRIASKFQDMLVSFVTREIGIAPVYITNDLVFQTEERDKPLTQWLTGQYQLVPHNLIFKLEAGRQFHDPGPLYLETRGLADGTLKFEPDDVVTLKVLPAYETMLVNRGRYLNYYGYHREAAEAFKRALSLDPMLKLAQEGLRETLAKLPASQ